MKKILSIALGLVMLVSLSACKTEKTQGSDAAKSEVAVETTVEETQAAETTVVETTVAETTAKAN